MNSIRTRLLLLLIVPLTFVAVIVSFETFYSARETSNRLHDKILLAGMLTISENVVSSNGTLLAGNTLEVLKKNLGDQFFYHVTGPNKAFVTGYSAFPKIPPNLELIEDKPIFYDAEYRDELVRVTALKQKLVGRELNGITTIIIWQKTTERASLTFSLFTKSMLRMIALILAAGVIVWFAIKFGLKPLRSLQQAIDSRTPHDLTPIKRNMPEELSGIVESMNDLFHRVALSKANRERFIGDAAHQLRNPIAALKVQAEASLETNKPAIMRKGLQQIVQITNQTNKLIEQMLTSASVNAMDNNARKTFDLIELTRETAISMAPVALSKNYDFQVNIPSEKLPISGHKTLLREAIINLIDNAIKYSPENGEIIVEFKLEPTQAQILIIDNGSELSEADLLKYSQPFYTGDQEQSGSGLGLAIAKEVAKSHGGHLNTTKIIDNANKHRKAIVINLPI